MPSRKVLGLSVLALAVLAAVYFAVATGIEQKTIAAQMPAPAAPDKAARYVDREALMETVRTLSGPEFAGRQTGTAGAEAARTFIVERLREARVEAAYASGYVQPFEKTGRGPAANVVGLVRGHDPMARFIVASAHFDHAGVVDGVLHPGADDNASGVAVLLAAAQWFAANRPRHHLLLAFFDAEELGLAGAHAFVENPPVPMSRVALNVNLDMVARSDRREIFAAGVYHTPWLAPLLQKVQRKSTVRILLGHDRPMYLAGGVRDWTSTSDHAAFHDARVPFLYFGVEDHADYHGPGDTADKIDPAFFGDVADLVIETLVVLDRDLP